MTNDISIIEKMGISSLSAFVELSGGQPLDRWKINLQLPKENRIPIKTLILNGPKEWYVASYTSMIQRCFFYIPTIYLASDFWKNNISNNDDTLHDKILHSAWVSGIVTPGVSWFENMKTEQQIGNNRNKNIFQLTKIHYHEYGMKGVMPSLYSTFLREMAFCGGICCITPFISKKINQNYQINNTLNYALSGGTAGLITQLISQPFDAIKTRQEKYKTISFLQTYKNIYGESNLFGLWKGSIPRCLRGIWTLGALSICNSYFTELYQLR